MPEVPAHITDGDIAYIWDVAGRYNVRIRSIQMEPCCLEHGDYNQVTIHFDNFNGYGIELRENIMNGYYSKRAFDFNDLRKGQLPHAYMPLRSWRLLPCESSNPPKSEYSHVVALQLQEVVREQLQHIANLFGRDDNRSHQIDSLDKCIKKMERMHNEQIECLEARIQSQEDYKNGLQERIIALESKMESDAREKEELKQKIEALTEWCSQPVWKRTSAFVLPKEDEEDFVSEF